MFKFLHESFFYVMGKALTGELSCLGQVLFHMYSIELYNFSGNQYLVTHKVL